MSQRSRPQKRRFGRDRFRDEAHFLRSWLERPLLTGAVAPSGKFLADRMASVIDARSRGPIIELGPGTGPVTEALLRRGIEQERLVLVEYNHEFCSLLRRRFPRATIVQGDAYQADTVLADVLDRPASGLVSGLPLLTKPVEVRMRLLQAARALLSPGAPFVQFTYATVPPIPPMGSGFAATSLDRVWRNVPPAKVWIYRQV